MLVRRPHYERQIMRYFETPLIKVLTGVRRCGKSSLLQLVAKEALKRGAAETNVITLRMDDYGIPLNPTADWLASYLKEKLSASDPSRMAYVFLDEIQDVPNWERVVRQLHTRKNTDIYLTGSNAYMLSTELSTLLSGRYVEIAINPLSFVEYLSFKHRRSIGIGDLGVKRRKDADGNNTSGNEIRKYDKENSFFEYLQFGGMPGQFDLVERNQETMAAFLRGIFDSVLLNDVAKRASVGDIDLLEKLVAYLFSTSGNLFSTKKIVDTLTSNGRKVSQTTVDNYLEALKNALIMREAPQFGLKGKSVLNPKRKFYAVDTGLKNLATGFPTEDIGFQLENIVCNELIKRGYSVSVGVLPDQSEIDFVARKGTGERCYYQVTQSLIDEGVYERELAPLRQVPDSFKKTVLTLDGFRCGITKEGINIVKLTDWLLETLIEDSGEVGQEVIVL